LNASGNELDSSNSGFYVAPVRTALSGVTGNVAIYNPNTSEVFYDGNLTFTSGVTTSRSAFTASGTYTTTVANGRTYYIFTGSGSITISAQGVTPGVEYFAVGGGGGGGGGGNTEGGGGGAGGLQTNNSGITATTGEYFALPTLTAGATYNISIGGGGGAGYYPSNGGNGGNTTLTLSGGSTVITAYGGGGGGDDSSNGEIDQNGNSGGCGGGGNNGGFGSQGFGGSSGYGNGGGIGGSNGSGISYLGTTYGAGGSGNSNGASAGANTGNGGNGKFSNSGSGGNGGSGIFIISYLNSITTPTSLTSNVNTSIGANLGVTGNVVIGGTLGVTGALYANANAYVLGVALSDRINSRLSQSIVYVSGTGYASTVYSSNLGANNGFYILAWTNDYSAGSSWAITFVQIDGQNGRHWGLYGGVTGDINIGLYYSNGYLPYLQGNFLGGSHPWRICVAPYFPF